MCTIGANWLEPTATQVVFVVRFLKKLVEHAIYGGMLAALPDYVATHFTWQRCQPRHHVWIAHRGNALSLTISMRLLSAKGWRRGSTAFSGLCLKDGRPVAF
jgi:hypothetical protein